MYEDKLSVVRAYLMGQFGGCPIDSGYDFDYDAHAFKVYKEARNLLLRVSDEFLAGSSAGEIGSKLESWKVSSLFEDPSLGVLLTTGGAQTFERH